MLPYFSLIAPSLSQIEVWWKMTCFCSFSALFESPLLRGQKAQVPNPMGFPETWPLPGAPPPMVPPDVIQPASTSLAETTRLFPSLPVRLPGVSPTSLQSLAPPVNFSVTHSPGGPGAACSCALPTTGLLTAHPGQSSFHGFCLLGHCLLLFPSPRPP